MFYSPSVSTHESDDKVFAGVHPDWIATVQMAYWSVLLPNLEGQKPFWPRECDRFNTFKFTGIKETKVLILGQDPYHGQGQATG